MIEFRNVNKAYGDQILLDSASFRVNSGEHAGIIGANGSGKSTLFSLLLGDESTDGGEILRPASSVIGHLRQHIPEIEQSHPLLTFAENALPELQELKARIDQSQEGLGALADSARAEALTHLGELQTRFEHLGGYEVRYRAEAALSGLGFSPEDNARPLTEFSGGWQMRAELARVVTGRPDILLLDEPTNFLDLPAVEWLRGFLADFSGTLLLISHDRYLLNRLTGVTLELAAGVITRYAGNYDRYVRDRQERIEQLQSAKRNQDRKRQQMERFVERFRSKATKATQVQSRVKMLEKMEDIRIPEDVLAPPVIRLPQPVRAGAEVVRLNGVRFSYDGQAPLYDGLDFVLQRGERAAIVGYNGSGKTTLLRLLAGRLTPQAGTRNLGHNVEAGYLAQDSAETMNPSETVLEVAVRARRGDVSDGEVRALLGALRFSGDDVFKPVSVLSGGERMRLALARLLVNPPNLLFLDEPTTHLDIASRAALQRALSEFAGTICLVSHDIEFVRAVATRIFAVRDRQAVEYFGGYDYYREKMQTESSAAAETTTAETETKTVPAVPPTDTGVRGAQRKQERRDEAKRRQTLRSRKAPLEKTVSEAEQRIEALEAEQARLSEEFSGNLSAERCAEINRRMADIQTEIAGQTQKWDRAATELEELA